MLRPYRKFDWTPFAPFSTTIIGLTACALDAAAGPVTPSRQNRGVDTGTIDVYPGIDPYGVSATALTTGGYAEGVEGSW